MRGAWVMLVAFGLWVPARADVSIGVEKPGSSRQEPQREWWRKCSDALDEAREALAKTDPQMAAGWVHAEGFSGLATASPDCEHDVEPMVMLSTMSGGEAFVDIDHGADRSEPWTLRERPLPWAPHQQQWERYEAGRAFVEATVDPAHPMAAARLRQALDVCIAVAPRSEPPPPPANDAEAAANELERACFIDDRAAGETFRPGRTKPRLARVLALGPRALPLLLRLAHGRNAAARATAAMGLARLDGKAAREALGQLAHDHAPVLVFLRGMITRNSSVATIAAGNDPFWLWPVDEPLCR